MRDSAWTVCLNWALGVGDPRRNDLNQRRWARQLEAPDSKETRPGSRNIRPLLTHFCVGVRRLSAVPTDTTLTDAFALTLPPIREGATPAGKQGTGGTPAFRAYVSNVPPAEPPRNVRAMKSVTLPVGSLRLD